jgi:dihydroflavonol-4-reductase
MAKTLLTGGSGFLGSAIARQLNRRGDDLRLALRESSNTENLEGLEFERVKCDLVERRAVRRALKGVDRVFHTAGLTSLKPADAERLFEVNVEATRILLEECKRADVERVVYTSSVAAIGPAEPGGVANESQLFTAGRLGIPYVNSKHEAEVEALRFAAQGMPVVCVNPCFVFGPGDIYGGSTGIVRRFLLGRIPAYVEGGINIVDVVDVARGHLLADQRGEVGERYILGNRNYTWDRLFADLGRLSGVEPPALKLPAPVALRLAQVAERLPGRPPITVEEVRSAGLWWTYRSNKAKRELGWKTSPHEDTIEATVDWYLEREGERFARARRSQPVQYKLGAAAFGVLRGAAGIVERFRPGLFGSTEL